MVTPRGLLARTRRALTNRQIEAHLASFRSRSQLKVVVASGADAARLAIVGNDQIASEFVDLLLRHPRSEPPVVSVLPARGGCEFVRMFGLPQTLEEAVTTLRGQETYLCDVGVLEGSWGRRFFLNTAEAGEVLSGRAPRTGLRLITPGRNLEGAGTGVLLANGQFAAGGSRVAPRATVVDGKLDVQLWDVARGDRAEFLGLVARGEHLTDRRVRRTTTASVQLSTERSWPVRADGTRLGTTPLSGWVQSGAVALKIAG